MALDDSFTKALLHFDGTDASTTFTDESGKTWSAAGNAQLDTAQSVFGGASLLLDGTNDYVGSEDSDDWYLDDGNIANDFTIDCRIRFAADVMGGICSQIYSTTGWWSMHCSLTYLYFESMNTTLQISLYKAFPVALSLNTWYHIAVSRSAGTYYFFKDGDMFGSSYDASVLQNWAAPLRIGQGRNDTSLYHHNGWIDEFRLSKGIARWTADFVPQIYPYEPLSGVAGVFLSDYGVM